MSAERHIKVFRVIDNDESDTEVKAEVDCRRFQFNGTSFSEFEKLVGKIFRLSSAGTETKFSLVYCKTFDAFGNHKADADNSSVIVISSDKDLAAAWSASILSKEEDPTTWEVVDDITMTKDSISVLRLYLKNTIAIN